MSNDLKYDLLGGHGAEPKKDCNISLPVQPQDQHRADEKYRLHGQGSIDELIGPVDDNERGMA
jgi:hypothetical protein